MSLIDKIKELFSAQENFAQFKLADGTIVMTEALEPGKLLEIIHEDGTTEKAMEGEMTLEDGRIIVIDAEGMIVEVKEAQAEEMPAEEAMSEVEVDAEVAAEAEVETPSYVGSEEYASKMTELEDAILMLTEKIAELEGIKSEKQELEVQMSAIKAENEELKSIPEPAKEAVEARFKRISDIIENSKDAPETTGNKFTDFIRNNRK